MREGMVLLCGLVFVAAYAQKVEPATIPAHKLSAAPVVDGRVDAAEWAEALKLEPFHNPVRGAPSELPTRAYLGYTDEAIYVAFVCDDPEPQRIQAHQTRRNGDMESDDHVIFAIDPQARGLEPYQFVVNPRGTQGLVVPEGVPENLRWQGDWQAAAQTTDTGWSAELRIPYGLHARLTPARDGEYTLVSLVREAPPRQLSVYATFTQIAPDYAPRLAFVPERGWRGYEVNVAYSDQPASSPVLLAAVRVGFGRRTRYGGGLLDEKLSLGAGVYLRNQTAIIPEVNILRRPPHTDRTLNLLVEWNISDASRSGRAFVSFGEQNGGDSFYWFAQQRAELLPRLRVNLTMEQLQIRYPRNQPRDFAVQAILTVNYELDAERVVGARWVNNRLESGGQSLSTNNFYLSYLQRLRTGQEVLMLLGAPNANRTQSRLAIKLVSPVEF